MAPAAATRPAVRSFPGTGKVMPIEFRLLGTLEASSKGLPVALGPKKRRAILAVLLLHPNEVVPADRIVDLVWGSDPPRTAVHAVHDHVSHLRKLLAGSGEPAIETVPPGYMLRVPSGAIDVVRFEQLVAEGRREVTEGNAHRGRETLHAALDLWRGEPLAEFPYAEFSQPEAARLKEIRFTALETLFAVDIATGRYQDTIAPLRKLIAENPFREKLCMQLMTALYLSGRQTEALRAYRDFEESLADTTGMEPSPAMQDLEERILRHDPALTRLPDTPGSAMAGTDRGEPGVGEKADEFFGGAGVLLFDKQHAPRVGLLFLGRENDRGFNDLGVAGLRRAVGALEIEPVAIPLASSGSEWELRQASRAVGKGLLVVMGFPFQPHLAEVASDFADLDYVGLDHRSEVHGVASIEFREHEGAFLVGAAAARTSLTGKLGFLGGARIAVIERFLAGFVAGARHVDSSIDFYVDFISNKSDGANAFLSPSRGYEKGKELYKKGADVVMHAAGSSGLGIFEAARVATGRVPKLWAIGADSDQYLNLRPDLKPHVLTSMMKRCDIVMFDAIRSWTLGELEKGSFKTVGLAEAALGYSRSGGFVDHVADELDALAEGIIAGTIPVPDHYEK